MAARGTKTHLFYIPPMAKMTIFVVTEKRKEKTMAKNHMAEVAKILGVGLGEKFEIKGSQGQFALLANGIYSFGEEGFVPAYFAHLMSGVAEIKRKPWMPQHGEIYWRATVSGEVSKVCWYGDICDLGLYKLGNCYRTKEEAEANIEKWKAFYASDEVLEIGGDGDGRK